MSSMKATHIVLSSTDVGKSFNVMLRPNFKVRYTVVVKESLLACKGRGQDLESLVLNKHLVLIAENDV